MLIITLLKRKSIPDLGFKFDLQLFGGGGGDSKNPLKTVLTIGAAVFGFYNPAIFGLSATACWGGALMGASLFTSVWSAVNRKSADTNSSSASIQRFDKAQETMSSDGMLPIIYGCRKISGNQTYHKANADSSTLNKHVVLCEGGIEKIEGLCANDLLIPSQSEIGGTGVVFTIQNVKYPNASFGISNRTIYLNCAGGNKSFYLCIPDDMQNDTTYWDYQTNVLSLISYINSLDLGWQAFPVASTNSYPGRLNNVATQNVYNKPVKVTTDSVKGGSYYNFYDCVTPSNYEEVGGYTNMSWLDMTFTTASEFSGNPSISCNVYGIKVYDIRTNKKEYSTNPAMCLRDFILSTRYGLGKWFTADMLDTDSWVESANYCDEIISFYGSDGNIVKGKRYELNIVIDSQRTALDWIQEILANFAGFLVYSKGKIKLRIEKKTSVSYKFNDDNMSDLKIEPLKLSETPNKYKVTFVDPLNNWKTVTALCEDYADQKRRQRIVTKEVSLEGVTSSNQALRLARFYRDYNLTCPMQISFTTGQQAMHLEPGDVVEVSYHGVFKGMPIRIAEIKETNKGTFEISGRQYNDTLYNDEVGGGINFYNYSSMKSPYVDEVPDVSNITTTQNCYVMLDGTRKCEVSISWNKPNYEYIERYIIEYSINGSSYITYGSCFDESCLIDAVMCKTYRFRITVENTVGRRSKGVISSPIYITGYNAPPSNVTGLTCEEVYMAIKLTWNNNPEPDIKGYNVYMGIGDCGLSSCKSVAKLLSSNTYTVSLEYANVYTFYVEAVDTVGNKSFSATKAVCKISSIPRVTNFTAVKNGDTIQFFWDDIAGYNFELRLGNSWHVSKTIAKVNASVYTLFFPLVGTYSFCIKAFNGHGLYSEKETYVTLMLTPETTRNLIATFDQREAGWNGFKNYAEISGSDLKQSAGYDYSEYYIFVHLNKVVDARNWVEYNLKAMSHPPNWNELDVQWRNATQYWFPNGDISHIYMTNYISTKKDVIDYLYSFDLNNNVNNSFKSKHITYGDARFAKGALVKNNTILEYKVSVPRVFNLSFNARHSIKLKNNIIFYIELTNGNSYLRIEYFNKCFYLIGSDGKSIELNMYNAGDGLYSFKITQTSTERTLSISESTTHNSVSKTIYASPIGSFNYMRLNK